MPAVLSVIAASYSHASVRRTPAPANCSFMPTSTSFAPATRMAWSYPFRCSREMMNSFFMPAVSGSRSIFARSNPASIAAVPSVSPADAPAVTYPASAPVAAAMRRLAAA
jgi:hypothetical protein